MSCVAEQLRELLDARDLDGFLERYEDYQLREFADPGITRLTQRIFPPLLRAALEAEQLGSATLIRLYKMVRSSRLLLVDDELLAAINMRIQAAMRQVAPATDVPVEPLMTSEAVRSSRIRGSPSASAASAVCATEVKRVAVVSAFTISTWSAVDAFSFRKNVCASRQEREFLRAVRQYFASLHAYPNVPLRNFIDVDKLDAKLPARIRRYAWLAQVDVLLCTDDEDPVAAIELDSSHHDKEDAASRDEMKNELCQLAGLPLVRIRADDERAVRAEDFYDLLLSESEVLDCLRPRRLRPRRTHDCLVPAESISRSTTVNAAWMPS